MKDWRPDVYSRFSRLNIQIPIQIQQYLENNLFFFSAIFSFVFQSYFLMIYFSDISLCSLHYVNKYVLYVFVVIFVIGIF